MKKSVVLSLLAAITILARPSAAASASVAATTTPAVPVDTFTDVAFRRSAASLGGVSAVCVSAMGTIDNTINDEAGVYWDNISIDYRGGGFKIIVR